MLERSADFPSLRSLEGQSALPSTFKRFSQGLLFFPWLLTLCLLLIAARFPEATETYALYPLLLGIVFLGLPHGALDHLVPARVGFRWGQRPLGMSLYLLLYVALAAAYYGFWVWQPQLAFFGFLLATVWHWGQGDLRFMEIFLQRKRPSRWGALVTLLLRGVLPMAVPILAFPETAQSLYRHMTQGLGLESSSISLTQPAFVYLLIGLLLCLGVAYFANALKAAPSKEVLLLDSSEVIILIILFSSLPAYLAVGVYFLGWHSLRHLARLLLLRPVDRAHLEAGRWLQPILKLMLDSVPITLAAIGLLTGLYFWHSTRVSSLEHFVALYLVLISSLTKPHLVVVAMMDFAKSDKESL